MQNAYIFEFKGGTAYCLSIYFKFSNAINFRFNYFTSRGFQMTNFLNTVNSAIRSFANDEEGAQVVEYALIIALVSIALALDRKSVV